MTRFWLGLALLSGSWLLGLDYFVEAQPVWWATCVAAGVILIGLAQGATVPEEKDAEPLPRRSFPSILMALAFVPAAVLLPWPQRLGPLLLGAGALLEWPARTGRVWWMAARGASLSGFILLVQGLALAVYRAGTARSHELPWPLPSLLAAVARWLGADAGADGSDLVLATMRHNHRLGATWELFLDPTMVCFIAGALAVLCLATRGAEAKGGVRERGSGGVGEKIGPTPTPPHSLTPALRGRERIQAALLFLGAVVLWLPLQAGIHLGLFLHRALRTDYEAELNLMNQFWSPWPRLLLLVPLALLVAWWWRGFAIPTLAGLPALPWRDRRVGGGLVLGGAAAAFCTLGVLWDPVGAPKGGRIAVDEFHSRWEPTQRPFDTEWYGHLSGYNYACLYDYCSRYYTMSRLTNALTDAALANLDVLILKVPTEPYQPAETDVIVRYVERGGSVLFIGEHTDVFNTGYHLNQVSRRFGFTFRYDCLFGMRSFFDQAYETPRWRHPVLQNLRGFDFATSCSIDPGFSPGRGVLVSTGLKNSMADYHANNYYPQAVDHAAMRYGAFVQLWAARHGRGRVLAFTDSTIFSNFSTFEPGKSELFLGMLEWLNRGDRVGNPRPWLLLLGLGLLAGAGVLILRQPLLARPMLAASAFGSGAAALALLAHQARALPVPTPVRPLTWVTIDRTVCTGPLSKGGFIAGRPDGFGIFERWILRLGYFIRRASGAEATKGDLIVFPYPTRPVTDEFRERLIRYVEDGGRLLVIDSPANSHSTAASLLQPFQLSIAASAVTNATLTGLTNWPAIPITESHEIRGGKPLFQANGRPVGAVVRRGKGSVVALGFGSRFSDPQMGVTGDVEPNADLRKVFDVQFGLLRAILGNQLENLPGPVQ